MAARRGDPKSASGIYSCVLIAVAAPWLGSVIRGSGGGERIKRGDGWIVELPKTSDELFNIPSTVQLLFLLCMLLLFLWPLFELGAQITLEGVLGREEGREEG
jgi:hypothetical protein